jgi:hypothetical protein
MRRRPFAIRVASREQGAIGVLFGTLVIMGVVIGMMALTVDVGNIMYERRQLQNGADATSLALADECARDADGCLADHDDLLNANAPADDLAQYDLTRAYAPDGACSRGLSNANLPNCLTADSTYVPDVADLSLCPPLPEWLSDEPDIPYVETYSRTESTESNNTLLPAYFSQAMAGVTEQASVSACARAAWGAPGTYSGEVPITVSHCEWDVQTSSGTDYVSPGPAGPWPGYGTAAGQSPMPDASREIVIELAIPNLPDPPDPDDACHVNGKDTPGGFGYVDPDVGDCSAIITTDNWVNIDTGNSATNDCKAKLADLHGKVIAIPVFDCLVKSLTQPSGSPPSGSACLGGPAAGGAKAWYHIAGWAKFYLSGYKIGGAPETTRASILTGNDPCTGSVRCLSGWYVQGSLSDVSSIVPPGGGTDYGTYAVLPAG